MARIDRDEVARIARLSRLELDEAALAEMTKHMQAMLEFAADLDRLDAREVPARLHGGEGEGQRLRPDVPGRSLSPEDALAMAPEKGPEGFRVPAILE